MARLNNVFELEVYYKSNSFSYVWSSIKRNFSFIKSQIVKGSQVFFYFPYFSFNY